MTVDVTGKRVLRALAVTLCFGAAAVSSPAHAQFFGWNGWDNGGDNGLPGPQVRRSITQQGFRVLGPLRRNGDVFVADVIDRSGRHERLIVGSGDAQILQRFYVDDGRGPGRFVRGDETDGSGGLVPPADIPGLVQPRGERPRRFAEPPADPAVPPRRFGDLDAPSDPDNGVVDAPSPRNQPPIRTVRPGPRTVERAPETPERRMPTAVESTPLAPVTPKSRPVDAPARAAAPKAAPAAAVASRPDDTPAPASSALPTAQPHRMTDPLAIPGGPGKAAEAAPARSVSAGVTGAPAAQPVVPAEKSGDVSAAPLD